MARYGNYHGISTPIGNSYMVFGKWLSFQLSFKIPRRQPNCFSEIGHNEKQECALATPTLGQ